jgi:hypothetical protein
MMQAIFQNTGQALHVSFLIMSIEARQKNSLRQALIQIIESVELPSARLKSWLEQLRGVSSGTVNFAGLDPYEVRAQCAMVTQVVRDHLPGPERDAVWARYSNQVERGAGVIGIGDYVRPQLPFGDEIAIRALVYAHFQPDLRDRGLSYQEISKERGIHTKTLKRATVIIANTTRILENMAVERLTPMFERDGLIESDENISENPYNSLAKLY